MLLTMLSEGFCCDCDEQGVIRYKNGMIGGDKRTGVTGYDVVWYNTISYNTHLIYM